MHKSKSSALKIAIICLTAIFVLISGLSESLEAKARDTIAFGGGKGSASGGAAGWPYAAGDEWDKDPKHTTEAWKYFVKVAMKSGYYKNEESLINKVAGLGRKQGFKVGDKTWSLVTSCKRSRYIWWYGSHSRWYSSAGKNDVYPPTNMTSDVKKVWNQFLSLPKSQTGWGASSGPVLVCSAPFEPDLIVQKRKIIVQAGTLTVNYDGKKHTVTDWDLVKGESEKLRDGDSLEVTVNTSKTKPGSLDVPVKKAIVRNKNGTNITTKYYKVSKRKGRLTIIKEEKEWEQTEDREERCLSGGSGDYITAVTENELQAIPVEIPGTASDVLDELAVSEPNQEALDIIDDMPGAGDTKTEWSNWKQRLMEFKSNRDIKVDLTDFTDDVDTFSETFSKYGGVLDVKLTETKKRMFATFCQPQYRTMTYTWHSYYDSKGNYAGGTYVKSGWTAWKDFGDKLIEDTDGPTTLAEVRKGYQILHVNCNEEGFNQVKAQVADKLAGFKVSGTSATLYTKKEKFLDPEEGTNIPEAEFFNLGRTSPSNQTKFYTEGPDCKENIFCNVVKGSGNDSSNNDLNAPLFQHVNPNENEATNGYGQAENGVITFFRDNENRTVRADLWQPIVGGIVVGVDPQVRSSYVKIFPGGTPGFDVTSIQLLPDELDPSATPGAKGFVDRDVKSDNDLQNALEKLDENGGTAYSATGEVNRLNFKSQWASNDKRPHKVGFNWVYNVTLKRNTLKVVSDSKAEIEQDGGTSEVEVGCEFLNTPGQVRALVNDNIFVNTGFDTSTLKFDDNNSVKVMFSRAISEKRD